MNLIQMLREFHGVGGHSQVTGDAHFAKEIADKHSREAINAACREIGVAPWYTKAQAKESAK